MKNKSSYGNLDVITLDLCILIAVLSSNKYGEILDLLKADIPNLKENYNLMDICINEIKKESKDGSKGEHARELVKQAVELKNNMYQRWAENLITEKYND